MTTVEFLQEAMTRLPELRIRSVWISREEAKDMMGCRTVFDSSKIPLGTTDVRAFLKEENERYSEAERNILNGDVPINILLPTGEVQAWVQR